MARDAGGLALDYIGSECGRENVDVWEGQEIGLPCHLVESCAGLKMLSLEELSRGVDRICGW